MVLSNWTILPHRLYFLPDVVDELRATDDFDVVVESEHKAAYAEKRRHVGVEGPAAVVVGCDALLRLRIFLYHEIVRELAKTQSDGIALLAREHEHVGVEVLVHRLERPRHVEYVDTLHSRELECLVDVRTDFVTTHVATVVHHHVRLHYAVGNAVAVGRRILAQHHHAARRYGFL